MTNISPQQASAANPLRGAQLSFIGVGVMAEAMIAGLLRRQLVERTQIVGSHPRPARREELQTQYGIRMVEGNREAATLAGAASEEAVASVVVIAVKPQRIGRVLNELKGALAESQLVLSIVAGARMEAIAGELEHLSVVRAMPNTPAQIGQGMTTWTATPQVAERQLEGVRALLGALGREMYVENENMIDMATALSATGPTYIF
ncbi:MAG: pyrroline-5-carboxylate reductase, partial [Acidobacteriota bacterium]|nr:pyrroline-5-carboxylate reductase [Acidobacteriota bacterium]